VCRVRYRYPSPAVIFAIVITMLGTSDAARPKLCGHLSAERTDGHHH
jgi:hypothetical protein